MIKHLNKNRICDFKKIFFNQGNSDNTKEIKRIFHYSNNVETNVFPIPAQKLRIQTNYDDWKMESRIMSSYSIVYPVPVIDCENPKMEKIRIDVTPFPENASWRVSYSDNYPSNLSSIHSNEIHHGKKTLGFEIPVPDKIGYTEYKINFIAINSDCEVQTFAFYCVKYAKSDLVPLYHWSFNDNHLGDENGKSYFNPVQGYYIYGGTFDGGSAGGNSFNLSWNDMRGEYQAPVDMSWYKDDTGMTLMVTMRGYKKCTVGFIDPATENATNGNHFYVGHYFRQPDNAILIGNNALGKFGVGDRLDWTKWHNFTLVLTPVIDLNSEEANEYFDVDTSTNEFGIVTYKHKVTTDKIWTRTGDRWNQILNQDSFKFRVVKFFVDGELRADGVVEIKQSHFSYIPGESNSNTSRSLSIKFEHEVGPNHEYVDDIKLFAGPISNSEIIKEASMLGYVFNDDGTLAVERRPQIEEDGRKRRKIDEINAILGTNYQSYADIPLEPTMKVFIIDSKTIALACNFREAFIQRLSIDFPNMYAVDSNFKYGYLQSYHVDYTYAYNLWDLYREYMLSIVERMDLESNFKFNGKDVELIGRWQNSTGMVNIPDFFEGKNQRHISAADITHFAYIRLPEEMEENNAYSISWLDYTKEFVYDSSKYCSSIKVNQVGYSTESERRYAYWGSWVGVKNDQSKNTTDTDGTYVSPFVGEGKDFHIVDAETNEIKWSGKMHLRINSYVREQDENGKYKYSYDADNYFKIIDDPNPDLSHRVDNNTGKHFYHQLTGESVFELDFSEFSEEGKYKIYIPKVGWSHPFEISKNIYGVSFYTHCRALFHHRSGCDQIKKPYTNWVYEGIAHQFTWESNYICDDEDYGACLTPDKRPYNDIFTKKHFDMIPAQATGKIFREIKGGWFDAADFDRRTYHFRVIQDLVNAYLLFPNHYADNQLNLPESGDGIPDILSEAEWGINVLRLGQKEDGSIAAWIETRAHEDNWPWLSTEKYYIGKHNRQDSLRYARCAAKLARAFKMVGTPKALAKSAIYTNSAIRAFEFGVKPENAAKLDFTQKDAYGNSYFFEYTETQSKADCHIFPAAVSLFLLTKEKRFIQYMSNELYEKSFATYSTDENHWSSKFCEELFLGEVEKYFPELTKKEQTFILGKVDQWYKYQESHVYHTMAWPKHHAFNTYTGWGMSHPDARGKGFVYAYKLTKNKKYKNAAFLIMDESLGCNPLGRTQTSGLGVVYPVHFLDSWLKEAEVKRNIFDPVPGISPYGWVGPLGVQDARTQFGFRLTKKADDNFQFSDIGLNMLPGGFSNSISGRDKWKNTIANTGQAVADWLSRNLPLQRAIFEVEKENPPQSEFTIWETICGKIFITGFLMSEGEEMNPETGKPVPWMPSEELKNKQPKTNRYEVEGLIYLP